MYVVVVEFEILQDRFAEFLEAVKEQARNSLNEESLCYRFDVCLPHDTENMVYLYEVYRDAQAFQEHLKTRHFAEFDAYVGDMIKSKSVRTMEKMQKNAHD
jgi:quinol monooxygenase YgiN